MTRTLTAFETGENQALLAAFHTERQLVKSSEQIVVWDRGAGGPGAGLTFHRGRGRHVEAAPSRAVTTPGGEAGNYRPDR